MRLDEFPTKPVGLAQKPSPEWSEGDAEIGDYDWEEAWSGQYDHPIKPDDVAEVLHFYAYTPEGFASTDLEAVFRLHDGRFATLCAWCDTTGWDCQANAELKVFPTYDEAMRLGTDEKYREWFTVAAPNIEEVDDE